MKWFSRLNLDQHGCERVTPVCSISQHSHREGAHNVSLTYFNKSIVSHTGLFFETGKNIVGGEKIRTGERGEMTGTYLNSTSHLSIGISYRTHLIGAGNRFSLSANFPVAYTWWFGDRTRDSGAGMERGTWERNLKGITIGSSLELPVISFTRWKPSLSKEISLELRYTLHKWFSANNLGDPNDREIPGAYHYVHLGVVASFR